MFIVPYMVVAAVAILFFIVCRFMVYGIGGKSRHAGVKAEVTAKIPVRPRRKRCRSGRQCLRRPRNFL